jgi:hypothetical protein
MLSLNFVCRRSIYPAGICGSLPHTLRHRSARSATALLLTLALTFLTQSYLTRAAYPRVENERMVISSLRTIYNAEITYQGGIGAGEFGTLGSLYSAGLIDSNLAFGRKFRYNYEIVVTTHTLVTPARFYVRATPDRYGKASTRSFYADEDGIIRGADKGGQPAGKSDPPVVE